MNEKIKIVSDGVITKVFLNGEEIEKIDQISFKHNNDKRYGAELFLKTYQNGLDTKIEILGFPEDW